jgi:hypothetical protein
VPFLLLGAARALLAVHDVGLLVAVLSWSVAMVFVAAVLGTISATYHRGARRLRAGAGPGAWAAVCVDARRPELWRAVIADAGGVRLIGDRRGTVVATWPWGAIEDVRVQRVAVADRTPNAVVLQLRDGSTAPLAFLGASLMGYPRRRANTVASELERRRQASGTATSAAAAPPPSGTALPRREAESPVPTPLPGPSGARLQIRGYLLVGLTLLVLLPSIGFEHYLPGGFRTELLTFIPAGSLSFAAGCVIVFAGMRKGRREIDRGYTTVVQTAGWDQSLFLLDWRDLSLIARPYEPRPEKLPPRRRSTGT